MAMTGGISSGGLITSVGGVGEKAVAAIDQNFSLILLPALSFNVTLNDTNETPLLLSDIQTPQESLHKIYSLDEAFFLATGKALPHKAISQPPTYYTSRMKETAQILCQRTNDLFDEVQANSSKEATDYYNQSLSAGAQGDYYSQASFCYSANLRLREQIVETLSRPVLLENYNRLNESLFSFEQQIEMQDIETLSDLETYIIVRERLFEAREYLNDISLENISTSYLSLAIERYYSAVAWSSFFGLPGEPLLIDENSLEQACIKEIREVESRANYLKRTIPFALLDEMYTQLNAAYEQYNENNYPLCIFKASKAKASAHMFMNELQSESQLQEISEVKLQRVEELIAEQQQQGIFPLMGYSYYEYAKQLRDDQPYVSLLFTEYALSMTDLSKYFPKSHLSVVEKTTTSELFYIFVGILVGFALSKITLPSSSKKKKSKKK